MYNKIQVKFDYGVFHINRSWVMALFLLENRDFLGFRMIFKVPLKTKSFQTLMQGYLWSPDQLSLVLQTKS